MKLENALHEMPSLRHNNGNYLMKKQSLNTQIKHQSEMTLNMEKIKPDEIASVVNKLNGFIDPLRTNLKFEFHEELNEYYVQVVNPLTNEVVKEIPPKKMLDMYAAMAEFMGILVDEKI